MKRYVRETIDALKGTLLLSLVFLLAGGLLLVAYEKIIKPFFTGAGIVSRGEGFVITILTGAGVFIWTIYLAGISSLPGAIIQKHRKLSRLGNLVAAVMAACAGGVVIWGLHKILLSFFPSVRDLPGTEPFIYRMVVVPGILLIAFAAITDLGRMLSLDERISPLFEKIPGALGFKRKLTSLVTDLEDLLPANQLNKEAFELLSSGRYYDALRTAEQACEIARKNRTVKNYPAYAKTLHNLGLLHKNTGNYIEAETVFRQTIETYSKQIGIDHPLLAITLSELASMYTELGRYTDAIKVIKEADEIVCKVFGDQHPFLIICLDKLATIYRYMGDYAKAEVTYVRASNITKRLGEWIDHLHRQRNAEEARELYRLGVGEDGRNLGFVFLNIGFLYIEDGRYDLAEKFLDNANARLINTIGEQHPDYARIPNAYAILHTKVGRFVEAESLYRKALQIHENSLGENHPLFASTLTSLADLYAAMGRRSDAEPLYRQAISVRRKVLNNEHPELAQVLFSLASLYAAMDRYEEALTIMEEVCQIDDKLIGQVFAVASENQRTLHLSMIRPRFDAYLSMITQNPPAPSGAFLSAFSLVLKRKAIEAEAWAVQREVILGGRYGKLTKQFSRLSKLRMQIAQITLAGPGEEGFDAYRGILDELTAEKQKLESELTQQLPEMNIERKLRAADREAVASALADGAALVEFVRFNVFDFKATPSRGESQWMPSRYVAFILISGEPDNVQMVDLGEAKPIDQMIARFRSSITGDVENGRNLKLGLPPSERALSPGDKCGLQLRKMVFAPLLSALGTRRNILISPDGDLTRLPFEVLPINDKERLIDRYWISYLGAGRDVLRFKFGSIRQPNMPVVAADPDFDLRRVEVAAKAKAIIANTSPGRQSRDIDRGNLQFSRLPATRIEGERVASMLGAKLWLGETALDARLKECKSPRILHLATHGFFLEDQKHNLEKQYRGFGGLDSIAKPGRELEASRLENPLLRSGLALAGVNTWLMQGQVPAEAEDGLLTAEDVSGLDLLDTELVVLSACETGLGEVRIGEGVFGLRRAFVLAGARTLVMSLWKVPDEQTQELMEDFYRRILSGQPRAGALREAQLMMKVKYPDPIYWGAFICQGEPGPLRYPLHLSA